VSQCMPDARSGQPVAASSLGFSTALFHNWAMSVPTAGHPAGAQRLAAIVRVQQQIATSGLELQAVLQVIAESAQELTRAVAAVVELADGEEMVYQAASGTAAAHVGLRLNRHASLSGLC